MSLQRRRPTRTTQLFWALRDSGGNNFGIVTLLTFQTYRIPELILGFIRWDWQLPRQRRNLLQPVNVIPERHWAENPAAAIRQPSALKHN
jgi:hypothetical protein